MDDRYRTMRRAVIIAVALFAALVATLMWLELRRAGSGRRLTLDQTGPAPAPGHVPERELGGEDVAQVVPREELLGAPGVGSVRRTGRTRRLVSVVDADELFCILRRIKDIPQEELVRRADLTVAYEDFADPARRAQIVGRACLFRGTLRRLVARKDVDLSPLGLDHLYEGQIQDATGQWYSFYCFQPPARAIGRRDVAELAGVFYKLIKYPTRGGEDMVTPLIVGRTLERRPGPSMPRSLASRFLSGVPDRALWVGLGGLFALAGALALLKAGRRRPPPAPSDGEVRNVQLELDQQAPEDQGDAPHAR